MVCRNGNNLLFGLDGAQLGTTQSCTGLATFDSTDVLRPPLPPLPPDEKNRVKDFFQPGHSNSFLSDDQDSIVW